MPRLIVRVKKHRDGSNTLHCEREIHEHVAELYLQWHALAAGEELDLEFQ